MPYHPQPSTAGRPNVPPSLPPAERSLFTRERNDGLYTTFTSLAGKMFDELVINALVA
jgi:hypothetical protein